MLNANFKNLIKFSAIGIIAIVGLFVFSQSAEAANRYRVGMGNWNTTASATDSDIGPGG